MWAKVLHHAGVAVMLLILCGVRRRGGEEVGICDRPGLAAAGPIDLS